ncbi:carboxy terminal-processing peptidase [Roseivirga sp. UBA1976]|uniref:carboxy terminal-processing peptidase n=1 Tax=Roseivirga sp. UBA1976 TaxID=1947386 RepID=UPI00257E192D|nr:carboxy terminal-processing peptidase [Roseivirga sp. UBA1976]MEC7752975.1 carboxy terminal-processing peptidase [Bacteroidota bacterium]|tara:strand:- start:4149 stop:6203 length:2055 start_codon:yes stop_codon:yes gene_type:complete
MKMMRKMMMSGLMLLMLQVSWAKIDSTKYLQPTQSHMKEARIIIQILDYLHYRDVDLNDSLSSVIFDNYLEALDGNKNYFLASDIKSFEKYRFSLDDDLKRGNLVPAFYIFNIYKNRVESRLKYALANTGYEFDFSKNEIFHFDRSDMPYAKTEAELDELWRKTLKNQALNLKLSGSDNAKIAEVLKTRYERFKSNVEKYNSNDVFEIFMNSVTESFDPHTNYYTPLNAEDFEMQSKKSLEGIGATLQQDNDYTKIVELRPGGPAFLSGQVNKDDRVVGVAQGADGEMIDVIGWRSDEVAGQIRGPKGTLVRLELLPAGASPGAETKVVSLVRDKINLDDARAKSQVVQLTENGEKFTLGIITVPDFYLNADEMADNPDNYTSTTNDVKRLIKELQAEGVDGVMLDLRNNGGGALFEAINLSGLFIPEGPVVQVKYPQNRKEVMDDENPELFYDGPLNVMINRFSASASEIFAGAIQDYKRGVIVGEQSYGKGTVQNVRGLNDFIRGAEDEELGLIKFTIAKFYRVTGSSTQHRGVTPDIEFPSLYSAEDFGESSQPSALPWDKIEAANYKPMNYVNDAMIAALKRQHQKRLKEEQTLVDLQFDIQELQKNRKRTEVSLNYEVRKKEQEDLDKRRASQVKIGASLTELEANKVKDRSLDDIKDPYLKESIRLLADQIQAAKRKG